MWVGAGWGQWGGPGPGMGCYWAEIPGVGGEGDAEDLSDFGCPCQEHKE